MMITIQGSREQIADLAYKIRMRGLRFDYVSDTRHIKDIETQSLSLFTNSRKLHYNKLTVPKGDKNMNCNLSNHATFFLNKVIEVKHGYTKEAV